MSLLNVTPPPPAADTFAAAVIRPYASTVMLSVPPVPPYVVGVTAVVARPNATVPVAVFDVICPVFPYTDVPAGIEIAVFTIDETRPLADTTMTGICDVPPYVPAVIGVLAAANAAFACKNAAVAVLLAVFACRNAAFVV